MQEGIISLFTLIYNPNKTNYKIINPLIHNLKLANVGLNQIRLILQSIRYSSGISNTLLSE